jgi:hypothetical protein
MNRTRWCSFVVTLVALGAGSSLARAQQCPWLASHHMSMSQTQYHVPAQHSHASSYHASQAYNHSLSHHTADQYAHSLYQQHHELARQRQEYQTQHRTNSESRSTTTQRQTNSRTQMHVAHGGPPPGSCNSMHHSSSMHLVTQRTTETRMMQEQSMHLSTTAQTSMHTVRQKQCKRHQSQQVAMQQHTSGEHHHAEHDKHQAGHDGTKTQTHHHMQMTCGRCHGGTNPLSNQPQVAQHQQHQQPQHQQPQHQQPQQQARHEPRPEARHQQRTETHTEPRLPALAMTKPYTLGGQFYEQATAMPPPLALLPGQGLALVRQDNKPAADAEPKADLGLSMLAQGGVDAPALPALGETMLMQPAPSPATETERGAPSAARDMSRAPALPPLPDASPDAPLLPRFPATRP